MESDVLAGLEKEECKFIGILFAKSKFCTIFAAEKKDRELTTVGF